MKKAMAVLLNLVLIVPLLFLLFMFLGEAVMSDYGGAPEFYNEAAVAKQETAICDALVEHKIHGLHRKADLGDKYRCYWHVGRAKRDPEICREIVRMAVRDIATLGLYGSHPRDHDFLLHRARFDADSCYRDIARLTRDHTLCDSVEQVGNRAYCHDDVWREQARDLHDPSLCQSINLPQIRANCYERVSQRPR